MPRFEIEIIERDMIVRRALVVIEAADEAEASDKAEEIEVAEWETVGDDTHREIEGVDRLD